MRNATLSLTEKQLKVIKNWKVGSTYTIKLKVKMTGLRMAERYEVEGYDGEGMAVDPSKNTSNIQIGTFEIDTVTDDEKEAHNRMVTEVKSGQYRE